MENNEDNEEFEKFRKFIEQYLVGETEQIQLIYTGIKAARMSNTVPAFLLKGPPGSGKTFITKVIAEYFNANYIVFQTFLNTSEDDLLYKFVPSENAKSGVAILHGPLPRALEQSHNKITVLLLDEYDKTRPSADAILLDYLQNSRITLQIDDKEEIIEGKKENLIIFLTSNDNRDFSEPLLRRVMVINFLPPSPKTVKGLLQKYFKNPKIIQILTKIYTASLYAGLSKPATIQELIQFGNALQIMPNASFNDLLYSFVIKNAEDMVKLEEALRNNKNTEKAMVYLSNNI